MNTLARVKELADERSISLYRLAQISGGNYSTLKATSRKQGQLSVDTIELVCVGLGITLQEFFSDDQSDSNVEG
jgi:transcriptional regulator with XRE-family HTH domain